MSTMEYLLARRHVRENRTYTISCMLYLIRLPSSYLRVLSSEFVTGNSIGCGRATCMCQRWRSQFEKKCWAWVWRNDWWWDRKLKLQNSWTAVLTTLAKYARIRVRVYQFTTTQSLDCHARETVYCQRLPLCVGHLLSFCRGMDPVTKEWLLFL